MGLANLHGSVVRLGQNRLDNILYRSRACYISGTSRPRFRKKPDLIVIRVIRVTRVTRVTRVVRSV